MSLFFQRHQETQHLRLSQCLLLVVIGLIVWWSINALAPHPGLVDHKNVEAAQADLANISKERHPVGSQAHEQVRHYLLQRIREIGWEAQVQNSFVINPNNNSAAQVSNIVVRVPRSDASRQNANRSLLVAGHYDSVANSYGAGDDGVTVANLLHTMQALKQEKQRNNDVIFLISDAEENGLLGALAFAEQHEWIKDVAMVLNFDNRGNSGPIMMFETSPKNGELIRQLARATPNVVSNSIMYEVYKALPNDTDFTIFRRRDIAGLNFAMIDNFSSYHTHHDTARDLNPGSLAQQQYLMRELVLHFSALELTSLQADNHVYFSLPLVGLVHYPQLMSQLLSVGIIVFLFLLLRWQRRQTQTQTQAEQMRWSFCFSAALLFLVQLALFGFLGQRAWIFICRIYPEYASLRDADNSHFYLLAFVLFFATLFTYLQKFWCRWWRANELYAGILLIWAILLAALTYFAPGASFLLAWPLLFALLAYAFVLKSHQTISEAPTPRLFWILSLSYLPGVILFAPLIVLFNIALGMRMSGVPIVLSSLMLALSFPVILSIAYQVRRWLPLLAVKLCIVFAAIGTAKYHQQFPEPSQMIYLSAAQAGQNWWLSPNDVLPSDAKKIFGDSAQQVSIADLVGPQARYSKWPMWRAAAPAPAPNVALAKPIIQVQEVQVLAQRLRMRVKIDSPLQANHSFLAIEGARVLKSRVNGLDFVSQDPEHWNLLIHGRNLPGATLGNVLEFEIEAGKAAQLRVIDTIYQWPTGLQTHQTSSDFLAMSVASLSIH